MVECYNVGNEIDTGNDPEKELKRMPEKIFDIKNEILRFKMNSIISEAMTKTPFSEWSNLSRKERNEMQKKMVDYIVGRKLNSKKDPSLEEQIVKFSKYSRKLKYLLDNPNTTLEKNLNDIIQIEEKNKKESAQKTNQSGNEDTGSLLESGWDWLKDKVNGLISHLVNLTDVPGKIGGVIGDVLAKGEKLIGQAYVHGTMDCSMFLSKIFCAGQGINERRLGTSGDFAKYEKVSKDRIRCGDIIYQASPAHVELIVSKPYVENGVTYINTIGSSTDKYNTDPMFDAKGNPIRNKTGVGYRKRQISPHPRHPYTYHRPPYEEWAKNREKRTIS